MRQRFAATTLFLLTGCMASTGPNVAGKPSEVPLSMPSSVPSASPTPYALPSLGTAPQKLIDIHAPASVKVGRPFLLYVDYDAGCTGPAFSRAFKFDVDQLHKQVKISLLLTAPSNMTCPAVFLPQQLSASLSIDQEGVYQLTATGYNKPIETSIEVVAADKPVPAWSSAPPITQQPANSATL